jgi:hypothetical protein
MPTVRSTTKTDPGELPSLAKTRLSAQAKRAKKVHALDKKLIGKMLGQLGVTLEELEKRADADFAEAKAESAERLKQLRGLQSAQAKGRGSLRARIEAAFARTEVTR